ncbi:MAG: bifunctional oligoribonuclease/PAP phosphatase NrnA [Promethearchaeota archaeon]
MSLTGFVLSFFRTILDVIDGGTSFLLVTHENADPDAVGSVLAARDLITWRRGAEASLYLLPVGFNSAVKRVLTKVPTKFPPPSVMPGGHDVIVFLDVNAPARARPTFEDGPKKVCFEKWVLVDHHEERRDPSLDEVLAWVDPGASSTCEMMATMMLELGTPLQRDCKTWLALGILTDSRNLSLASRKTLATLTKLLEDDDETSMSTLINLLKADPPRSERIARLKGAKRAEVFYFGDWIVAITRVSSFGGSVCKSLVTMGADVAVCLSFDKKQGLLVTCRAGEAVIKATGLSLPHLLEELERKLPGQSGGHQAAAGYHQALVADSTGEKRGPGAKKAEKVLDEAEEQFLISLENFFQEKRKEAGN